MTTETSGRVPWTQKYRPKTLSQVVGTYRALLPQIPIGISLGPGRVASNVQVAVNAQLDFVTLLAIEPDEAQILGGAAELEGLPQINVLADAVQGLRAINREEDIDLIYFGCIRGGADTAKALALGATVVTVGQAALIAAQSALNGSNVDQAAQAVHRFLQATLMEISILARGCGKTDVHNLEPEDLRSLTIETSRATGMPLVGRDLVFRNSRT